MIVRHVFPGISLAYSTKADGSLQNAKLVKHWLKETLPEIQKTALVMKLVHGADIQLIHSKLDELTQADAVITTCDDIVLSMCVADCVPILLFDAKHKVYALIHGGWRSLIQNIVEITLMNMRLHFQINTNDLYAWIGPSIQKCCNSVNNPALQSQFSSWIPYLHTNQEVTQVDLQSHIQWVLQKNLVKKSNIIDSAICTYHQKDEFYSHRRAVREENVHENGRMAIAVWRE